MSLVLSLKLITGKIRLFTKFRQEFLKTNRIDLYLILTFHDEQFVSSVSSNNDQIHQWDEQFFLTFQSQKKSLEQDTKVAQILYIECWDYNIDEINQNNLIGKTQLDLTQFKSKNENSNIQVILKNQEQNNICEIDFEIDFQNPNKQQVQEKKEKKSNIAHDNNIQQLMIQGNHIDNNYNGIDLQTNLNQQIEKYSQMEQFKQNEQNYVKLQMLQQNQFQNQINLTGQNINTPSIQNQNYYEEKVRNQNQMLPRTAKALSQYTKQVQTNLGDNIQQNNKPLFLQQQNIQNKSFSNQQSQNQLPILQQIQNLNMMDNLQHDMIKQDKNNQNNEQTQSLQQNLQIQDLKINQQNEQNQQNEYNQVNDQIQDNLLSRNQQINQQNQNNYLLFKQSAINFQQNQKFQQNPNQITDLTSARQNPLYQSMNQVSQNQIKINNPLYQSIQKLPIPYQTPRSNMFNPNQPMVQSNQQSALSQQSFTSLNSDQFHEKLSQDNHSPLFENQQTKQFGISKSPPFQRNNIQQTGNYQYLPQQQNYNANNQQVQNSYQLQNSYIQPNNYQNLNIGYNSNSFQAQGNYVNQNNSQAGQYQNIPFQQNQHFQNQQQQRLVYDQNASNQQGIQIGQNQSVLQNGQNLSVIQTGENQPKPQNAPSNLASTRYQQIQQIFKNS